MRLEIIKKIGIKQIGLPEYSIIKPKNWHEFKKIILKKLKKIDDIKNNKFELYYYNWFNEEHIDNIYEFDIDLKNEIFIEVIKFSKKSLLQIGVSYNPYLKNL